MKRGILLIACLPIAAIAADPYSHADPKRGKTLHDGVCIACHARMYGGDGSTMYTREGRVVTDKNELLQRVAACSARVDAHWLPEDEINVAAYLNQRYYKFKR